MTKRKKATPSPSPPASKRIQPGGAAATASAAQNDSEAPAVTVSSANHQAAVINATYSAELQDAIDIIKEHHVFADLAKEKPLSTSQAAFTAAGFNTAMAGAGVYRCGGNMLWLNIKTSTSVPIRAKKVAQIRKEFFNNPSEIFPIGFTVIVGVLEHTIKGETVWRIPTTSFGQLDVLSPEEMLHAPILQIAHDIRNGMGDDGLQKWRNLLLSIPLTFKVW